jgi:hypothetical protein
MPDESPVNASDGPASAIARATLGHGMDSRW